VKSYDFVKDASHERVCEEDPPVLPHRSFSRPRYARAGFAGPGARSQFNEKERSAASPRHDFDTLRYSIQEMDGVSAAKIL